MYTGDYRGEETEGHGADWTAHAMAFEEGVDGMGEEFLAEWKGGRRAGAVVGEVNMRLGLVVRRGD